MTPPPDPTPDPTDEDELPSPELDLGAVLDDVEERHEGLDDASGMDEEEALELDLAGEDEDEPESDLELDFGAELEAPAEESWTGAEPALPDVELDLAPMPPLAGDDGGDEGVEDDELLPPALRRLAEDEEEDDEGWGEDDSLALGGEEDWASLPASARRVRRIGEGRVGALAGDWAAGDALWDLATWTQQSSLPAFATSLAVDGPRIVIGTRHGCLRSSDAGRTLLAADQWAREGRQADQPFDVVSDGAGRLWGFSQSGGLFRSDDGAATWSGPLLPAAVVALASPGRGRVLAVTLQGSATQLARSDDGIRWAARPGPACTAPVHVACLGEVVVLAGHSTPPWLSRDGGLRGAVLPGVPPSGPVALAREQGGLVLYATHAHGEGTRVVRHRPFDGEALVVLEAGGPVTALRALGEGRLQVGCEGELIELEIDADRFE